MEQETNISYCPHCGAKMKKYWHKLTPILVSALVKFRGAVTAKGENSVHLKDDMDGTDYELTRHERSNWTKLRFHGLVAKVKNKDGSHYRGHWLITKRGSDFLNGRIQIPAKVLTFRNQVINHDDHMVNVKDVIGSTPYVEDLDDIEYEIAPPTIEFDEKGQGMLV